ncbi:hypothetical protein V6N13_064687 [Hibiscus sabdariffa]
MPSLSETIQGFTVVADIWNKTVFGYINVKKLLIFFRELYLDHGSIGFLYPYPGSFPTLPGHTLSSLTAAPSLLEVWKALHSMAPLKAYGLDNLHAKFYQKHWDILGHDVFRAISQVFAGVDLEPDLYHTTVVLIPKVNVPQTFSDF